MYIVILREPSKNNAKMYSLKANKGDRLEYYKKKKKRLTQGTVGKERTEKQNKTKQK